MSNVPYEPGRVTLVGGGPGNPELLTLKAVNALKACDVVLYDALVNTEILRLAGAGATRINVGKRAGAASWKQADINDLMVRLARRGKRVVRLKAGDPSIFGRSGEEIAALRGAGIAVEVVPGITTASAFAGALGVSLTHRAAARSLRFVTASSASGGLPADLDWRALADPVTTLIVYMARRSAAEVAGLLIAEGRAQSTPVLIAEAVSTAEERYRLATLADLAARRVSLQGDRPLTLGIGEVFADANAALLSSDNEEPQTVVRA